MRPLSQIFTPTPQHDEQTRTPNAPAATMATPGYFLDDIATPAYFYNQNAGPASPPYFCDSPLVHESDDVLPPAEPAADVEMLDPGPFGCETPRAYEDEQGTARPYEALMAEKLPVEDEVDDEVENIPPPASPEEPEVISNLRPIVLKTIQSKKKKMAKRAEPDSDITCTVEVITWSWFMNLPLEVRNRIYNYYFFPESKDWAPRPTFGLNNTWRMKPPPLLQSDPYIRQEAIAIYYSELQVSVASPEHHLVPWLKTLDRKARNALKDITISYDDEDPNRTKSQMRKSRCIDRCCKVLEANGVRVKRAAISGVYMGGGTWL